MLNDGQCPNCGEMIGTMSACQEYHKCKEPARPDKLTIGEAILSFHDHMPHSLTFSNLFTIHNDGTIEKLSGFTTNNEMSLKFWETLIEAYPAFREFMRNTKAQP